MLTKENLKRHNQPNGWFFIEKKYEEQKRLQIGVMDSASNLRYSKKAEEAAYMLGKYVAKGGNILVFGAEKNYDSLSTAACRGAKSASGITVGITYGKGKNIFQKDADIIIASGLERGGGRELTLVLSCDVIIAIGGGSGTLTELAITYQADIPMVALKGFSGWSDKLVGKYFDKRKRRKVLQALSAKQAVEIAINCVQKN